MPRQNDIGTIIRLTITQTSDNAVLDGLESASTKQIFIKKPSGTVLEKTASYYTDGTDGIIQYTTISGDLDEVGEYEVQGYVVIGSAEYRTETKRMEVNKALDA